MSTRPYIVRETFTTIRNIEAESEAEALAKAKEVGCLDFDEIDNEKETIFSVELDVHEEKYRQRHAADQAVLEHSFLTDRITAAADAYRDVHAAALRKQLVEQAAGLILATAADIAPDASSFTEAVHAEGHNADGDHALIVAEETIAQVIEDRPEIIDLMRTSIEWDTQVRGKDVSRAALALINEAYPIAEAAWQPSNDAAPKL